MPGRHQVEGGFDYDSGPGRLLCAEHLCGRLPTPEGIKVPGVTIRISFRTLDEGSFLCKLPAVNLLASATLAN